MGTILFLSFGMKITGKKIIHRIRVIKFFMTLPWKEILIENFSICPPCINASV
jgi:hypothetical protein